MDKKRAGVLTTVPQFTVPEIYIDDGDDDGPAERHIPDEPRTPTRPPDLSVWDRQSMDISSDPRRHRISPPSLDTSVARSRANSIQATPIESPTRGSGHRRHPSDLSGDWQLAAAMNLSRPVSPMEGGGGPSDDRTGGRSRANSAVSHQDVLDVLDSSAWGESIRRSFTLRRSSGTRDP